MSIDGDIKKQFKKSSENIKSNCKKYRKEIKDLYLTTKNRKIEEKKNILKDNSGLINRIFIGEIKYFLLLLFFFFLFLLISNRLLIKLFSIEFINNLNLYLELYLFKFVVISLFFISIFGIIFIPLNFKKYIEKLIFQNRYERVFTVLFFTVFIFSLFLTTFSVFFYYLIFIVFLGNFIYMYFFIQKRVYIDISTNIKNEKKPIFISDNCVTCVENDKLSFYDRVVSFSKLLKNGGSNDNQVFGLVAERGVGKTSFLKLLKNYTKEKNDVIYINFNPWYYEGQQELLDKLFSTILVKLNKQGYYVKNISKTFTSFINILDNNSKNLFGINIPFSNLFLKQESLHDTKIKLNNELKKIDKKLVIIIDDLDRVTSDKFIEVLKIIDLVRDFNNTSFVVCYDPENFNIVDSKLLNTQRSMGGKMEHIESQKFDNTELTKYMGKIINVYFPLEINLNDIKNEFINIFLEYGFIGFSYDSELGVKKGIENLFTYTTFNMWGKYYSDIRSIKRILNNFISLQSIIGNGDGEKFMRNLFDADEGIRFDTLVKLSILKIYFSHIYRNIRLELITENKTLSGNCFLLSFITTNLSEKDDSNYLKYLNTLTFKEATLLENLFPKINKDASGSLSNNNSLNIRTKSILIRYFDIESVDKKAGYNREIILYAQKIIKNNFDIFEDIFGKYGIKGVNDILHILPSEINKLEDNIDKIKLCIGIIDYIITYDVLYKFYDNSFSFYLDIANILNSSVRQNINSKDSHIKDYIYGNKDTDALFVKIFDFGESIGDDEGKIRGLQEGMRLLLAADKSRGGDFYIFERAISIDILYNSIYKEFKKRIINDKSQNFVKFILNFEKISGENLLGHFFYMLLHYAPKDKKEILTIYFIECFKDDTEDLLKWIYKHIEDDVGMNNKKQIHFITLVEYFDEKLMKNFIEDSIPNLKKLIDEKGNTNIEIKSKYVGYPAFNLTYSQIFKLFLDGYNIYIKNTQKKI